MEGVKCNLVTKAQGDTMSFPLFSLCQLITSNINRVVWVVEEHCIRLKAKMLQQGDGKQYGGLMDKGPYFSVSVIPLCTIWVGWAALLHLVKHPGSYLLLFHLSLGILLLIWLKLHFYQTQSPAIRKQMENREEACLHSKGKNFATWKKYK